MKKLVLFILITSILFIGCSKQNNSVTGPSSSKSNKKKKAPTSKLWNATYDNIPVKMEKPITTGILDSGRTKTRCTVLYINNSKKIYFLFNKQNDKWISSHIKTEKIAYTNSKDSTNQLNKTSRVSGKLGTVYRYRNFTGDKTHLRMDDIEQLNYGETGYFMETTSEGNYMSAEWHFLKGEEIRDGKLYTSDPEWEIKGYFWDGNYIDYWHDTRERSSLVNFYNPSGKAPVANKVRLNYYAEVRYKKPEINFTFETQTPYDTTPWLNHNKPVKLRARVNGGESPFTYKWYARQPSADNGLYTSWNHVGNGIEQTFYLMRMPTEKTEFKLVVEDSRGNSDSYSAGPFYSKENWPH